MITTFLLADSLKKGGPGSGPHGEDAFNSKIGTKVTVNKPGHSLHGKTGTIARQNGMSNAVSVPGHSGVEWFHSSELN